MRIYVAASSQERGRDARKVIVDAGHTCTSTWLDDIGFGEQKTDDERRQSAVADAIDVRESEALILLSERDGKRVKGGKHVETGMALALGYPVYVVGAQENIFHWHPSVAVVATVDEVMEALS